MREIILSFPHCYFFPPVFLSGFCKPIFWHYFIQKGKALDRQEVTSLLKKAVVHLLGRKEEEEGLINTRSRAGKLALNHPALGHRFPHRVCCLVLHLVWGLQMEAGCFKLEPNTKNRTSGNIITNLCLLPTSTVLFCERLEGEGKKNTFNKDKTK